MRHIDAHQRLGRERMRRFFERFAHDRLGERFTRLQMAGGLVETQPVVGVLLDEEKTSLALDNGGHGDVRSPSFRIHGAVFYRLWRLAARKWALAFSPGGP